MLSHNNVQKVDELKAIGHYRNLTQLDLVGNDVENAKSYREEVFSIFPNLKLLD